MDKTKTFLAALLLAAACAGFAAEAMPKYPGGKKCAIAFTFDDATVDQYDTALPILEKHGVKAVFNVIPELVDRDGYMTWEMLRDLVAKGHALGNHTMKHVHLVQLLEKRGADAVKREIQSGHDAILENTGYDAKIVCYPYNAVNDEVEKIVRDLGYESTPRRMGNWGGAFNGENAAAYAADLAKREGCDFALVHGVRPGGGWAAFEDPKRLDEILSALKANPDVCVAGFEELVGRNAKYRKWRERTAARGAAVSETPEHSVTPQNGVWDVVYGRTEDPKDVSFSFKLKRFADGITVVARVIDDRLVTDDCAPGALSCASWDDDNLEIFFDGDNDGSPDCRAGKIINGGEFTLVANGAANSDYSRLPLSFGKSWTGVAAPRRLADGTYVIDYEIHCAWECLGITAPAPDEKVSFGFNICVHDDDDGGRNDHALYWKGNPEIPCRDESQFGKITL